MIKILLKFAIIGAIFYFIIKSIYSSWDQLDMQAIHIDFLYIILSVIVMQLAWFLTSWAWGKTLEACNYRLAYSDIFVLYFRSMVGKYLPGKLWQLVSCTYMAAKKGVPEGSTVASLVIAQSYSVLSGLVLAAGAVALGLVDSSGEGLMPLRWTALPILAILLILALKPDLSEPLLNRALVFLKRQPISIRIKFSTSLGLFSLFFAAWLMFGLTFWLLARGMGFVPLGDYLPFTAIYTAATVFGFLAIFAPGGLGVREGLIVVMMSSLTHYPASFSAALALAFRILTSIVELADFGMTWPVAWSQGKQTASNAASSEN